MRAISLIAGGALLAFMSDQFLGIASNSPFNWFEFVQGLGLPIGVLLIAWGSEPIPRR